MALAYLSLSAGCSRLPLQVQPASVPRVGFATGSNGEAAEAQYDAIRQGLREHGYEEGRDILVEWRSLDNRPERAVEVVDEFLRLGVTAIVSAYPPVILAAKKATSTIPIVMAGVFTDPVGQGVVRNLNRPGENVTGLSIDFPTLSDKRLQVLKDAFPAVRRLGLLWDKTLGQPSMDEIPAHEAAAQGLGLDPRSYIVERAEDIEPAFAAMQTSGVDAVHVSPGPLFAGQAPLVASLALQHRLPSIARNPDLVRAGLLIAFGIDQLDLKRRAVGHLHKILKGAKPGDLPVEQPTAVDFIINLRTARDLGLVIPPSVLAQATEVIQ